MKRFLIGLGALLWSTMAQAGVTCTLPFNLQNATTADATQVMANYNALVTCLGNAAAAGTNSDITALLGLLTPITPSGGGSTTFVGGTSTGTALAQVVNTTVPTGFSLAAGNKVLFIPGLANTATTGSTTLNVNGQGAVNLYNPSPSGPVPFTGGELQPLQIAEVTYDGTQFQLTSPGPQFGGIGAQVNLASNGTTDLGTVGSHNVRVTGTNTINSFGSSASLTFPYYQVVFQGVLTLTQSAGTLDLPGAANITTANSDFAIVRYQGPGAWRVLSYNKSNGTAVVNPTPNCGFNALSVKNNAGTPSTNVDVAAGTAVLVNPTGNVPYYSVSPSFTINLTTGTVTSTANGMDGEARPTSGWVYLYMISNGTLTAGLGSSTTSPTLPAGYIYACYMGAMRTDGSANLLRTKQLGNRTQYTASPQQILLGATGSISVPTWTSFALGAYIPPTATTGIFSVGNNSTNSVTMVAPNSGYGAYTSTTNPPPCLVQAGAGVVSNTQICEFLLESTNVYAAAVNNGLILSFGWRDAVGAN